MGLDMYIYRKNRGEEVAYWRKANAVLKWLERHLQTEEIENCREYYIPKEMLEDLKADCLKVLSKPELEYKEIKVKKYNFEKKDYVEGTEMAKVLKDSSIAEELMPTESGFFFGPTLYDEWYLESLKNTVSQIDNILETTDFDEQDLYFNAWW